MMLSAKIAMRSTAPPANMLNMPRMPDDWRLERLREGGGIDARERDVGAEPIDDERAQREPDALLEILGLGEGAEIQIGGKLLGGGNHCSSPWAPSAGALSAPLLPPSMVRSGLRWRKPVPRRAANAASGTARARPRARAWPTPRSPPAFLADFAFLAADFFRLASSAGEHLLLDQLDRSAGLLDRRLGACVA